ncbi:hypothetical protein [Cellulophaga sp. E6(2014)]|uniref:hypothetical protein n=1 Tax=Cellulophaga sp. E6(2014) TaxID=1495334 RepID=UPI000556FCF8|nr:hypothetical protein [Cellulophaga sp. E6(2014)]
MKKALIIILLAIISCKTDKNNVAQKEIKAEIVSKKSIEEIKYVIAKSGLIYRDKAKGKPLGKFEFGDKLKIITNTNIKQFIFDDGYIVKGNWLGIEINNDTVYAFGGYLAKDKEAKIYKSTKRLKYLFYSNGGLIGYFSDGTITGCARCDPDLENISSMYSSQTTGRTYTVNDKGEILVDWGLGGELEIVKPVEADEYGAREWGIINYKEVF